MIFFFMECFLPFPIRRVSHWVILFRCHCIVFVKQNISVIWRVYKYRREYYIVKNVQNK